MEFNVFEYFKDYKRITKGPMTPEEQGTALFLAGNMGERIREFADVYAEKNRLSRRHFFQTASGLAACMLAVNKITGMGFFDVSEAAAAEPAAAKEIMITRKPGGGLHRRRPHPHLRSDLPSRGAMWQQDLPEPL